MQNYTGYVILSVICEIFNNVTFFKEELQVMKFVETCRTYSIPLIAGVIVSLIAANVCPEL